MEKVLRTVEKFIPKKVYHFFQPIYHYLMSLAGAILYGFPARKIYIVGITGTKGKTSTTEIMNAILEKAGMKTALSNGIRFKIGDKSLLNKYKMSMPGRFFMQKFISDAVKADCTHAVIEMTSEGSKFFRHKFIWCDTFMFTNLAPEHIEAHGSYAKYLQAKLNLADNLRWPKKNTTLIVNGDDIESEHFLKKKADKKISYYLSDVKPIDLSDGIKMRFGKNTLYSNLIGEFNAYNILAAITFAKNLGISDEIIKEAIEDLKQIPGRGQKIEAGQSFEVYVDYAHTKESLEALYKTFPNKNKVCVLGNCGGGRDKWKRPEMAKIAEQYCDEIILTDEDPYDEDPNQIVDEMKKAITKKPVTVIMDRRTAINDAIQRANKTNESVVLITGKGTDPYIMGPNGTKTPWLDSEVATEEIRKVIS
jgi:UDP-N-acetylmuramoyl-L-alanyl-D-glutamate--2,6-diaminopimelate ligase